MPVSLQFSDVLLEKNDDNTALKRQVNELTQELNQLRAAGARVVRVPTTWRALCTLNNGNGEWPGWP